jgi:general nucleoside transport system ATP-binding protein
VPGVERPLLQVQGLTKAYGSFLANDSIDLEVREGEVHALLGENGAGKSTLVKALYGLVEPSAGRILWQGREVAITSPVAARSLGIGMVFQQFSLFENLTVAENVAVGLPQLGRRELKRRLTATAATFGLAFDPDRPVWTLSAGERQRIEIVRCLLQEPKLLVLDEPTSVLTPQEAEQLFAVLERLTAEGRAILYISHKLEEVRRLCRRATILRHGRVVATLDPRAASAREIAALMVGGSVASSKPHAPATGGADVLRLDGLSLPAEGLHGQALDNVSLTVRASEILGIAGVAGNGQSELFAALSGERRAPASAMIRIDGRPAGHLAIEARRCLGAAFVPEERLGHGAVPTLPLSDNTLLSRRDGGLVSRLGWLGRGAARRLAGAIRTAFDVRAPGDDPPARRLSGGNLQKFVVGREIIRRPRLLVVDQPTWGVDAGAARLIRDALIDLANQGSGVLVISQDLDELFELADSLAVIHAGRLTPVRRVGGWTREEVGLAMAGSADILADAD